MELADRIVLQRTSTCSLVLLLSPVLKPGPESPAHRPWIHVHHPLFARLVLPFDAWTLAALLMSAVAQLRHLIPHTRLLKFPALMELGHRRHPCVQLPSVVHRHLLTNVTTEPAVFLRPIVQLQSVAGLVFTSVQPVLVLLILGIHLAQWQILLVPRTLLLLVLMDPAQRPQTLARILLPVALLAVLFAHLGLLSARLVFAYPLLATVLLSLAQIQPRLLALMVLARWLQINALPPRDAQRTCQPSALMELALLTRRLAKDPLAYAHRISPLLS